MKFLLAAMIAAFLIAPASATPAPNQPTPEHKAYKTLLTDAAAVDANYDQVVRLFQSFVVSVYMPYCKDKGGLDHVVSDFRAAWPAKIYCKADPKNPLTVEAPK